ncbi:hypothetical protein ACQKND_16120 [Viridibacillus arvi]|uniref:hypothetical protein n=1 Tax=Viridibacillus arvi TaxID=263475 RepID=UPI003D007C36
MMKKLKLLMLLLCVVSLVFSISNSNQVSAATSKVDFTKTITSKIKTSSKSYKFDVAYKTDFYMAVYLGNSENDNETHASQYTAKIYNSKNKVVATSKISSFHDDENKTYFIYQLIDKQLAKGSYTLKISTNKDVNFADYQTFKVFTDREVYGGTVFISSLKANKKSPQVAKTKITLTTKAKGSYLKYQYSVTNTKTNKKTILRKYSSNKTATWKPSKAGTYKILVTVNNTMSGKLATKSMTYKVKSKK